jgi:hypothetical protein
MNIPVSTKASLILAVIAPVIVVGVFIANVGPGNGAIYPMMSMFFVPFAIGAGLALGVRTRPVLSWLVLLSMIAISIDGLVGLYSAFFRVPARGGQDLIFRPFEQIFLIVAVSIIVVVSVLIRSVLMRGQATGTKGSIRGDR